MTSNSGPATPHNAAWEPGAQQTFFNEDDYGLLAAAHYIELNPVRSGTRQRRPGLAMEPRTAHLAGKERPVGSGCSLAEDDRRLGGLSPQCHAEIQGYPPSLARPVGRSGTNVPRPSEEMVGRALKPQKHGPKLKQKAN